LKLIIAARLGQGIMPERQIFLWAKDKDALAGSLASGRTKHHPTTCTEPIIE
jgi:hypothetical protein